MATKKKAAGKNGESKGKKSRASKKKSANLVRIGPRYMKKIRVPINANQYGKKESELAQIELQVAKLQRAIKPTQIEIRSLNKKIDKLTVDLEENTEEREVLVRNEFRDNTNEVRVLRADNGACVEERTMTAEDRQIDVEDERPGAERDSDEEPAATPGEALSAARDEEMTAEA